MNWKLIIALSPVGPIMGSLMISGVGNPWIVIFWMVFCVLAAFLIAKNVSSKWVLTCILTGILWGILHNILESIFFDSYLANNPGFEEAMSNPDFIPARYFVLLTGPLAGFGTGLLIVIFSWIIKRFIPKET